MDNTIKQTKSQQQLLLGQMAPLLLALLALCIVSLTNAEEDILRLHLPASDISLVIDGETGNVISMDENSLASIAFGARNQEIDLERGTKSNIVRSLADSDPPPPPNCINDESEIEYVNGEISATNTFYACLKNIAEPLSLPSIYNGTVNGVVDVLTSIQFNNLHEIDAVAGTATLDFYLRLYWRDDRYNMPLFWNKISKKLRSTGIELTLIKEQDEGKIWYPDVRFHDVTEIEYIVEVSTALHYCVKIVHVYYCLSPSRPSDLKAPTSTFGRATT
jgi:hypothetical protein